MRGRSRRLSRRARIMLFWAVLVFLFTQLGGGVVLDYFWTSARFPSAAGVLRRIEQDRQPIDVLCLGSSRVGAGMSESIISQTLKSQLGQSLPPRVLNASIPAGDFISSEYVLQQIVRRGFRPSLAVIEVSPETLNRYDEWFFFHVRRQLRWQDIPEHFTTIWRSGQLGGLVAARLIPLSVHRRGMAEDIVASLRNSHPTVSPPALAMGEPVESDAAECEEATDCEAEWAAALQRARELPTDHQRELTAIGAGQPYRWLRHYRIAGSPARALDRLLLSCRQMGITPLLVELPVTARHREAYTPAIEAEYQTYLKNIRSQYGCAVVDYRDRLPDVLFLDNHHMLHEGAVYFSRILAQEVLAPALESQR